MRPWPRYLRGASGTTETERWASAGGVEFLGHLPTGLAGTDNQHGALWQLLRVAVIVRVELCHIGEEHGCQRGNSEFSDASAPALKELKRKIDAIERALKYLTDHGLEPRVDSPQEDEYPTATFSEREPWFSKQGG
jgi:hypothetical protein